MPRYKNVALTTFIPRQIKLAYPRSIVESYSKLFHISHKPNFVGALQEKISSAPTERFWERRANRTKPLQKTTRRWKRCDFVVSGQSIQGTGTRKCFLFFSRALLSNANCSLRVRMYAHSVQVVPPFTAGATDGDQHLLSAAIQRLALVNNERSSIALLIIG